MAKTTTRATKPRAKCAAKTPLFECFNDASYTDWRKDCGTVSLCGIHHLSDVPKKCTWCGNHDARKDDGYCSNGCRSNGTMAGLAR